MHQHELYIKRCLALAQNGLGTTYPNPLVGSVIVLNGKIIGEGWHKKAGEAHAEVNAINAVKDKSLLKKATIYVSLEPCSHFGKTPPCSDLIITHKIPHVVIGTIDPFAKVCGNGIKKLKEAGIKVTVGVLEKECQEINKRFFTFHQKKRPYIILKWAESKDGFFAPDDTLRNKEEEKKPYWITNQYSRQLVHKWRTEEQAILVGTQTVLADNPKLDARDYFGNNPIRIAFDQNNKIPEDFHIKKTKHNTIIYTNNNILTKNKHLIYEKIKFDSFFLLNLTENLHKHNIQSIIIEGGSHTIQRFIDQNLWDEARVFIGDSYFNTGLKAPQLDAIPVAKKTVMKDEINFYKKV